MHLSLHNWMRVEPIERSIARIAQLGYSSIEISGEPERYDTRQVRKLLAESRVACWGSVTLMTGGRNLVSADERIRAESVSYAKDCVRMVSELDGEILSLVPGTVGKIMPDAAPEDEWNWAVETVSEICQYAEAKGVRVGIEPLNRFESYLINRADQALALCDAVGHGAGVALDVFHMSMEEHDLLDAIRAVGPRLVDFHVAENNRMPAGHGDIDWPAILTALDSIQYSGALSGEFAPTVDRTPANRFPHALEQDRGLADAADEQIKFLVDHGSSNFSDEFFTWAATENVRTLAPLIDK